MKKTLSLLLALFLPVLVQPSLGAEPENLPIDNLVQIIPDDASRSYTASWQDSHWKKHYTVEYRQQNNNTSSEAAVSGPKRPRLYDENNPAPATYSVRMKNLKPETAYEYRIKNDNAATGWFPFQTTAKNLNHYKVLVFGDSQSTDYSVWGDTAQTAWNANQDASFFISMGDLTDNGQAYFQWQSWYENANILTEHMPIVPVLGNHEAYSLDWKYALPDTYEALFAVPDNGPQGQKGLAFTFDYGDVRYLSLNTDYEEIHQWYPQMMDEEAAWLETNLAQAKKDQKRVIVLMHRPPWDSPYHGVYDINGRYFAPIFDKYDVPLVLEGHEHCYARSVPVKDSKPAAKGTIYITTGRSGTESWDAAVRKPFDEVYYNPMDMPMYLTLTVEPKDFLVKAYKTDGTIIDSIRISTVPGAVLPSQTLLHLNKPAPAAKPDTQ